MSGAAEDILFKEVDSKGIITLNRTKALNALTEAMVKEMYPVLKKWEGEKKLVIIKGIGEKAFCAGGDVVALTTQERRGDPTVLNFFRLEYTVNNLIGTYQIPYVAFITGIVMGGGAGVSVHGKFRVASDRSMFAMPETAIGLFPDVGGSHFLPRLGGGLGMFLALTGHRLRGGDLFHAGLATHYCPTPQLAELEAALLALPTNTKPEHVQGVLDTFHQPPEDFSLAPHLKDIKECFTAPSLVEIIVKLEKSPSEFCSQQLSMILAMSPTSVAITHEQVVRGAALNLQDCLRMEFRMVARILKDNDFFEGVRARLVDKDNKPAWRPATLSEVDYAAVVSRYFDALPPDQELQL